MLVKQLKHWERVEERHTAIHEFIDWLETAFSIRLDWDYAPPGTPLDIKQIVDAFLGVDRAGLEADRRELIAKIGNPDPPPLGSTLRLSFVCGFVHQGKRLATVQIVHKTRNAIASIDFVDGEADRILFSPELAGRRKQLIRLCSNYLAVSAAERPIYRNFGKGPDYVN